MALGFVTGFTGLPLWLTGEQRVDPSATAAIPDIVVADRQVTLRWRL